MTTPYKVGKIELTTVVLASTDDNDKTGTKVSGYAEPKYGPFSCDNCVHYDKDKSGCNNSHVLEDPELKTVECIKAVEPKGCCTYFRSGDSIAAYGTSEGVKKEWDERGRGRYPKETEGLSKLNHILTEGGFKVGSLKDLPPESIDQMDMKPPVVTPNMLAAAEGVSSALQSLKNSKDETIGNLYKFVKDRVFMVPSDHEPDGAAMTTIGKGPNSWLVLNTKTQPTDMLHPTTIGGIEGVKKLKAGSSQTEAVSEAYRWGAWHEMGHVLDNASNHRLQTALFDKFQEMFGDDDRAAIKWLGKNISEYASSSGAEAVAEMTSLVLGGRHLPKELKEVEDLIRGAK